MQPPKILLYVPPKRNVPAALRREKPQEIIPLRNGGSKISLRAACPTNFGLVPATVRECLRGSCHTLKVRGVATVLCRVTDLRYKEVVNLRDGTCLGCVSDVEVDTVTAKVVSLIIYGRCKLFGLFFREEDIVIHWCDIEVIGEDTILVNMRPEFRDHKNQQRKSGFFAGLFG